MASTTPTKVDRHLTTPFLLKVFYKVNSFHRLDDFRSTSQPSSFVEVYTWKDCSLSELTTLLLSALPSLASGATKCAFRLIYADTKAGRYTSQELGNVLLPLTGSSANGASGGGAGSEKLSLDEARFVVGDWIDVAVTTGSASSAGPRGGPTPGPNGIRIRGRGGIGGSIPQGDWRKGDRLDDEAPIRGEGPPGVGGGRRFGGGGHGGGRRGGRW